MTDHRWLGLAEFLAPEEAKRQDVELEIEGQVFSLDPAHTSYQQVSVLALAQWQTVGAIWPADRVRIP